MPLRRFVASALGASIAAALGLAASSAAAQTPAAAAAPTPPPAREADKVRFALDVHAGLLYRVGDIPQGNPIARGGGLAGLNLFIAPKRWLFLGVGYERAFFGRERLDTGNATFNDIDRTFDALWGIGRFYPWQNDDIGIFVELAAAPVWQSASSNSLRAESNPAGQVNNFAFSCTAHDHAGLGLRAGIGADVHLSSLVSLVPQIGVDHLRLSDSTIDGCVAGAGASTFLAARLAFMFTTGREKPAEPPPPADRDHDGIPDDKDACPDVPGVPNADPKKNGCPSDRDNDGILDSVDACPDVPGVANADPKKNGCPSDRDNDGIIDTLDACPDVAGVPNEDPKKNGCPPDKDGDGIVDSLDACPDIPGVATNDPATNGCPPDTDGDGIRDDKDACPLVKGVPNKDPKKNGCPLVVVTEKQVEINEQIQFDTDKATIKPESDGLLNEIASVIIAHPELKKIEVQGHTDDTGTKPHNNVLSAARAESVRAALVKRKVENKRLTSKGYGQTAPIADNATEDGRTINRRVQFNIVEKADKVDKTDAAVKTDKVPPKPKAKP